MMARKFWLKLQLLCKNEIALLKSSWHWNPPISGLIYSTLINFLMKSLIFWIRLTAMVWGLGFNLKLFFDLFILLNLPCLQLCPLQNRRHFRFGPRLKK